MKKLRFWGSAPRTRGKNLVLAGVICLALLALTAGMALGAEPRAVLTETVHDFGKVFEDKALTYTFLLKNEGNAPLRVEDVDPDCACTVADYDRVIPPGGQGRITLGIKPYSVLRDFLKLAKVKVNDPARPEMELSLKGYVQPIIEIQPNHIVRLRGRVDEEVRGQVRFISHLPAPWQITSFDNSIPQRIAVDVKVEKPGQVYVLEVRNLSRESGNYGGKIELHTTSAERPRLIVRVFANIYPAASGTP
jgi:hypothetical protein